MSKNCQDLQNDFPFVSSAQTSREAKLPKSWFSEQTGTVNKERLLEKPRQKWKLCETQGTRRSCHDSLWSYKTGCLNRSCGASDKTSCWPFSWEGTLVLPNASFCKELKITISQTKSHSKGNVCLFFLEAKVEKKNFIENCFPIFNPFFFFLMEIKVSFWTQNRVARFVSLGKTENLVGWGRK